MRENRSDNHEWTIQRNWQYSVHEAQDEDKKKDKKKQQQQKPRKKTNKQANENKPTKIHNTES